MPLTAATAAVANHWQSSSKQPFQDCKHTIICSTSGSDAELVTFAFCVFVLFKKSFVALHKGCPTVPTVRNTSDSRVNLARIALLLLDSWSTLSRPRSSLADLQTITLSACSNLQSADTCERVSLTARFSISFSTAKGHCCYAIRPNQYVQCAKNMTTLLQAARRTT